MPFDPDDGRRAGGARLAELLAQGGGRVRGGSSDPSRVDVAGVEPVAFSWDDPSTWAAAVRDVDAIYLVRPDRADAPELARDLLAVTADDTHVVLLSELDRGAFDPDDWAPRTERAVREGAGSWTILQPGLVDARTQLPRSSLRLAWVDCRARPLSARLRQPAPAQRAGSRC